MTNAPEPFSPEWELHWYNSARETLEARGLSHLADLLAGDVAIGVLGREANRHSFGRTDGVEDEDGQGAIPLSLLHRARRLVENREPDTAVVYGRAYHRDTLIAADNAGTSTPEVASCSAFQAASVPPANLV